MLHRAAQPLTQAVGLPLANERIEMSLKDKVNREADRHLANAGAAHLSKIESTKDNAGRVEEQNG